VPPFKIRRLTPFSLFIPAALVINVGFPVGVLAAVERKGEGEEVGKAVLSSPATPQNGVELILDRRQRLLRVMEGNQERRRFRVGVGMPGWETPVGSFSVIEKTAFPVWEHPAKGVRIPPGPSNPLGSRWIGFHRDCKGRRGFNGQEHLEVKGCVSSGFHGTPQRDSVGAAVSHGCVRLFDEDVRELFDMVQLGTPVTVLP